MYKLKKLKKQNGEMMIEAILVMIPTIFILVFLLGLGFLIYQQWNIQLVADDIANKVSSTYKYMEVDTTSGDVSIEQLKKVEIYRNLFSMSKYKTLNTNKAKESGKTLLRKTNFSVPINEEEITLNVVEDSLARRHLCVTVVGNYKIPFAEGLEIFGIKGKRKYKAISYAECIDMSDYISTVNYVKEAPNIVLGDSKIIGAIDSWINVIKKIKE